MSVEELKVITEALQGMGADAKTAFIWWVVVPLVQTLVNWAGGLLLAFIVCLKTVPKVVRELSCAHEVARAAASASGQWSYDDPRERRRILRWISKQGEEK